MSLRLRHVRATLLAVAVSLTVMDFRLHSGATCWRSLQRPAAAAPPPPPFRGYFCNEMIDIVPVLLNANLPYPHALNVRTGSIGPGETAKFYVYGLTGTPRYANVTSEFIPEARGRSVGKVRVKPAPGSRSIAGRLHVVGDPGQIRIEYRPNREASVDRTAVFTFTYDCGTEGGLHMAQFELAITGLRSAARQRNYGRQLGTIR